MKMSLNTRVQRISSERRRSRENPTALMKKRVTPFSIDDILANKKSKPLQPSLLRRDPVKVLSQTCYPSYPIDNTLNTSLSTWNQDAYLKWFESLQRLCAVTALQPYFLADPRSIPDQHLPEMGVKNTRSRHERDLSMHRVISDKNVGSNQKVREHNLQGRTKRFDSPPIETSSPRFESRKRQILQNGVSVDDTSEEDIQEESLQTQRLGSNPASSPLHALEKLTCSTFRSMEKKQHQLHSIAVGREARAKRRKCRTAFTAFQLSVLEQRFNCHKYLTPADRDQIAHALGLTAPQVITWFQNRRAKLKRDVEEMTNDIKTVKEWPNSENVSARSVSSEEDCMDVEVSVSDD